MKEISTMNREIQRKPAKSKAIASVTLAVAMVAGGLLPFSAEALVLGQVRVLSHLGEPLRAEIPVTQLNKDEGDSLMVGLASPSDFSSRGLIYTSTLSTVRISYEMTGNNTAMIFIRSARPIQDPFVDMLMDVRWRAGNLQRSYTMLIDPPPTLGAVSDNAIIPRGSEVTSGGSVAPIGAARPQVQVQTTGAPVSQTAGRISSPTTSADDNVIRERILRPGETIARPSRPQGASQSSATSSASPTRTASSSVSGNDLHIRVERGQTLGKIANSVKPANVTTEQMLAALYKANPSAFINNNINWVKSGATLRIPSEAEIAAISPTEARSIVSAHARQFNQRRSQMAQSSSTVTSTAQAVQPGVVTPLPAPTVTSGGRDVLVVNTEQERAQDQTVTESQRTQENIIRGAEIQGHRDELENIQAAINGAPTDQASVGTAAPLVVTDTVTVADQPAPAVEQPTITVIEEPAPVVDQPTITVIEEPAPVIDQPVITVTEEPAPVVDQPAPAVEQPKPAEPVTPPPAPRVVEQSWLDIVLDNIIYVAGALVAIAALVGGLLFVRRRKNAELEEEGEEDSFFEEEEGDSFYGREEQESDSFMLDQSSSIYAASQLDANADVDPVQEADVYLAYGRDEQAAEILRDALSSEPDRVALHAKLCEVYARQNDIIAFEEQAMRLHSLTKGTGFEWERIARLAQSISPNKIGALGSDIPDTRSPMSTLPTIAPVMRTQEDADTEAMEFDVDVDTEEDTQSKHDDAFSDLDVSLDFSSSVNPEVELDPFTDSSSDAPSFAMEGDDEDEGPATRLALAEEFFAIGNKEDAKEIIEEVLKQKLSADDKKRAASLMNKIS